MNFFCYLYAKLRSFINAIAIFIGLKPEVDEPTFQEGELTVVGQDEVEIFLDKFPEIVLVEFTDSPPTASCNPDQDSVTYCVKSDYNCNFFLKIKWSTSSVRKVYWRVNY